MKKLIVFLTCVAVVLLFILFGLPFISPKPGRSPSFHAKSEMAAFASIETLVKEEYGFYVRLADLGIRDIKTTPPYIFSERGAVTSTPPITDKAHMWGGPYTVLRTETVTSKKRGSLPVLDTDVIGWTVDLSPMPSVKVPYGTPLDPWKHPYMIAYNDNKKTMVIYSAGPDGKLQTGEGALTAGDAKANGTEIYPHSDDLVYCFK